MPDVDEPPHSLAAAQSGMVANVLGVCAWAARGICLPGTADNSGNTSGMLHTCAERQASLQQPQRQLPCREGRSSRPLGRRPGWHSRSGRPGHSLEKHILRVDPGTPLVGLELTDSFSLLPVHHSHLPSTTNDAPCSSLSHQFPVVHGNENIQSTSLIPRGPTLTYQS